MNPDLIYDVGMHNGDDTAYYLARGYRVIAIEANPELVAASRNRFPDAIRRGRLVVINAGLFGRTGLAEFWVNRTNSVLSSFDRAMAERWGGEVEPIQVRCLKFEDIMQEYGVPYYLKIDIEGADHHCLTALSSDVLPAYLSAEAHSLAPLFLMQQAGYQEFKLISQRHHNTPRNSLNLASETSKHAKEAWRLMQQRISSNISAVVPGGSPTGLLRKVGRKAARLSKRLTGRSTRETSPHPRFQHGQTEGHVSPGERFPMGSSGPFGEDTFGEWRSFEEVAYDWLHLHQEHPHLSSLKPGGWFDFHARRDESRLSLNPPSAFQHERPQTPVRKLT